MTDEFMELTVGPWLKRTDSPPPAPSDSIQRAMAGVRQTPQVRRSRLWPIQPTKAMTLGTAPLPQLGPASVRATNGHHPARPYRGRMLTMSSALKFATAGIILALVGGFVIGALPQGEPPAPAAPASASPAPSAMPTVLVEPQPIPSQAADDELEATSVTPEPRPSDKPIVWHTPAMRLEADAIVIEANGKVSEAPTQPDRTMDEVGIGLRQSDVWWREDGERRRLQFRMWADGTHWWVGRIWTHDGVEDPMNFITYADLKELTRTPLGEWFEGDLVLEPYSAVKRKLRERAGLRIEGLRLIAFWPGSGPAKLTGCDPMPDEVRLAVEGSGDYGPVPMTLGSREFLGNLVGMSPAEASDLLGGLGVCHEYQYLGPSPAAAKAEPFYPERATKAESKKFRKRWCSGDGVECRTLSNGRLVPVGYRERWCSAPPGGHIVSVGTDDRADGVVTMTVWDDEPREPRDQPVAGWDCPTN